MFEANVSDTAVLVAAITMFGIVVIAMLLVAWVRIERIWAAERLSDRQRDREATTGEGEK